MKRFKNSYEYKMVKQITAKENKKALKKASVSFLLLMTSMYLSLYTFLWFVQWVWL